MHKTMSDFEQVEKSMPGEKMDCLTEARKLEWNFLEMRISFSNYETYRYNKSFQPTEKLCFKSVTVGRFNQF